MVSRFVEDTVRRYSDCPIAHRKFVRGKLRWDPMYRAFVPELATRSQGTLLDLGAGRGIALALIDTVRRASEGLPELELRGVELRDDLVQVARTALRDRAKLEVADLARYEPPPADVVLLLDVLHHLDDSAQRRLLGSIARGLRPGGRVFLRVADAGRGVRFAVTRLTDRLGQIAWGHGASRCCFRRADEWIALLADVGLAAAAISPLHSGTPFANVLIEARQGSGLDIRHEPQRVLGPTKTFVSNVRT